MRSCCTIKEIWWDNQVVYTPIRHLSIIKHCAISKIVRRLISTIQILCVSKLCAVINSAFCICVFFSFRILCASIIFHIRSLVACVIILCTVVWNFCSHIKLLCTTSWTNIVKYMREAPDFISVISSVFIIVQSCRLVLIANLYKYLSINIVISLSKEIKWYRFC
jgi:hypothetical protein